MNFNNFMISALYVLIVFLTGASALASDGIGSTGGGNAVVCTDASNHIQSVEVLDLYEAKTLRGPLVPNNKPAIVQAEVIAANTGGTLKTISDELHEVVSNIHFLPVKTRLVPVQDSNSIALPDGCQIVQLARYEPNGRIYINVDLWAYLDEQNKAALYIHETVYHIMRMNGDTSSDETREIVGLLFSGQKLERLFDTFSSNTWQVCTAQASDEKSPFAVFYAYPKSDKSLLFLFVIFNHRVTMTTTSAVLEGLSWPLGKTIPTAEIANSKLTSLVHGGVPVMVLRNMDQDNKQELIVGENVFGKRYEISCVAPFVVKP